MEIIKLLDKYTLYNYNYPLIGDKILEDSDIVAIFLCKNLLKL